MSGLNTMAGLFRFTRREQWALLFLLGFLALGLGVKAYRSRSGDRVVPDQQMIFSRIEEAELRAAEAARIKAEQRERKQALKAEAARKTAEPVSVNINSATAEELTALPRIGPKTATRIIAYRKMNGPFGTVGDLAGIKGIGEKTVERLRAFVITE